MGASRFEKAAQIVAKVIRERRIAQGKTQEDIAHTSGLSLRHYQKIEAGLGNPTLQSLILVTDALGCSLGEIFPF